MVLSSAYSLIDKAYKTPQATIREDIMEFEMFMKFVTYFNERRMSFDSDKVSILGGYAIRVGKHMFQYDYRDGKIVQIK